MSPVLHLVALLQYESVFVENNSYCIYSSGCCTPMEIQTISQIMMVSEE